MRKIVVFFVATADGYYEGPNGEFDWPNVDEEFERFAVEQLKTIDTLLFGRATYEMMAAHWPTPEAKINDPEITTLMNDTPKIVVSRTMTSADWAGTRVLGEGFEQELAKLKEEPGRDIIIMGSSELCASLLRAGLLDEVRIMVMPIVLGAGKSLLRSLGRRIALTLLSTRSFDSGSVLLTYRPETAG